MIGSGIGGAAPVAVQVWALWRGGEVSGAGGVELRTDGVRVEVPSAGVELFMPFMSLDGARVSGAYVVLYPASGDVVELSGPAELESVGRHLRERACTLPELTLALRGLGSARGHPGPDHDGFFAPFLAARKAVQRASNPADRLAAVRPAAIAAELDRVMRAFAVERFPASAPDRRALETELNDLAAPIRVSLRRLEDAARAASTAGDDTTFVWWRAWAAECRALFAHADRCWLAAVPVLTQAQVRPRRFWHWWWGRGDATDGPVLSKGRLG